MPILREDPMSEMLLLIVPDPVTPLKELLSVGKQDWQVVYFHCVWPVFSHAEEDLATFRMIAAQFVAQGHLRLVDVSRSSGAPRSSGARLTAKLRLGFVSRQFHGESAVLHRAR